MPRAVTNAADTQRFALKSAPADPNIEGDEQGFVVLRRLTYGEFLHRRSLTADMRVKGGGKDFEGIMQLMNESVTKYEFKNCIVEHNLLDESGELLDFSKPTVFKVLDPRIGEEIAKYIDEMNQGADDDEDEGNS